MADADAVLAVIGFAMGKEADSKDGETTSNPTISENPVPNSTSQKHNHIALRKTH